MQWSEEGIVLAARAHGERALVVQLLTREHGRHAGLLRGGQAPKTRAHWQIGNRLLVTWRARLAEHLGFLTGEVVEAHAANLLDDPLRLGALASAAALAASALPEREPHPRAYRGLLHLLEALGTDDRWAIAYVEWEIALLEELGFGLDLSSCAATGATEDLVYVSPRSGQAVSAAAGAPYREKLLSLPAFLRGAAAQGALQARPQEKPTPQDVLDGLRLAGFFLEQRVFAPHQHKLPAARSRYVDALTKVFAIPRS
ncbi:MAG TPA: DNA repair protein RecO [Stellaceae bacterium]|jgi:DNA repair protein RecO (recombination protein O)|nr:DNA repair protein RecO [Stellaceae bacterium]